MQRILLSLLLFIVALSMGYSLVFSDTARYKHEVQLKLDGLTQAVESQEAAKVKGFLDASIDDFAHINLEVHLGPQGKTDTHPPAEMFGKTEFLNFVDNILYSVNAWHFRARVGELELTQGRASGTLTFSAQASAHDTQSALAGASSEFTAQATCHAKALFDAQAKPTLGDLACVVTVGR